MIFDLFHQLQNTGKKMRVFHMCTRDTHKSYHQWSNKWKLIPRKIKVISKQRWSPFL